MDYSKMSDAEIAQKVWFWWNNNIPHDNTICCISEGKMLYQKNRVWTVFDPCNKPAEAWPIIAESGISINHYNGVWEASFEWDAPVGAFGTDETVTTSTEHKNPLRAAMVAYLMMREVNDVQGNPA